jgi:hypothetical protein
LLLIFLITLAIRRVKKLNRARPGWWKVWQADLSRILRIPWPLFKSKSLSDEERDPLLPASRQGAEAGD